MTKHLPLSSLNTLLKAESTAQLNAEPYERTDERKGSRNGFRDRDLTTRLGTITLHVPKHRDGVPLKRRSKVIGVFPNESSLMRLMGSVLIERNEDYSTKKRVFSNETYRQLLNTDISEQLIKVAKEQRQVLKAA